MAGGPTGAGYSYRCLAGVLEKVSGGSDHGFFCAVWMQPELFPAPEGFPVVRDGVP